MKRHLLQSGFPSHVTACSFASLALFATTCATLATFSFAGSAVGAESSGAALLQPVKWQTVDDDVLAHQTGKYAGAPMISGFVLNVLSQWQLPNGATAIAGGSLNVTRNAANQLGATVNTMAQVTDSHTGTNAANSGANPNAQANGGQSIAVNGVSQVTQVAGDRNSGMNSALIDFNNNAAQLQNFGGSSANSANASNSTGNIQAGITFANGGITVSLRTPAGMATQTIAPNNTAQAGAIAQMLQIAGNNQQVANQLQLHLQTQAMTPAMLQQAGVLQALQNAVGTRR